MMDTLTFILAIVTPAALLVVGILWKVKPPDRVTSKLCYRTALSEKNDETWRFAHRSISTLWLRIGLILGVLTAVLMRLFDGLFLWMILAQMAMLCASAFLVDTALKAKFDSDGKPIE